MSGPTTPLAVLAIAQAFVSASSLAFFWAARPDLLKNYAESNVALPALAQLALSSWFLVCTAGAGLAVMVVALASRRSRGRRMRWIAIALTGSGLAFIGAALSAITPLI